MKKIVIAVCGIVKNKNKFLLTQRAEPRKYRGKWQFPGGALEDNESFIDCLKRELKEELNIEITNPVLIPKKFVKNEDNFHLVMVCYLCRLKNKVNNFLFDKETLNYGWFRYREIVKLDYLDLLDKIAAEANKIKYT